MKKYCKAFTLALSSTMQYRANLVLWLLVAWMQPITSLFIWFTLASAKGEIGGYDKGQFLIYYLVMTFTWYLVGGVFAGQLGSDIKFGRINKTLVMPYNLILDVAVKEQAWKVVSGLMSLPILFVAWWWGRGVIEWQLTLSEWWFLLIMIVLGALVFALMEALSGLSAFWLTETWPVNETVGVLRMLFGGVLAPISLLPGVVQKFGEFLPFRYMFYPAVSLLSGMEINPLGEIARQLLFIVIMYWLVRLVWARGLKKYEGIGG